MEASLGVKLDTYHTKNIESSKQTLSPVNNYF